MTYGLKKKTYTDIIKELLSLDTLYLLSSLGFRKGLSENVCVCVYVCRMRERVTSRMASFQGSVRSLECLGDALLWCSVQRHGTSH